MSVFLRSIAVISISSLLLVACGEKEASPVATPTPAPAAAVAPTPAADPVAAPGGYEPTAEERVPGITVDAAAPATDAQVEAPVATPDAAAAPEPEAK